MSRTSRYFFFSRIYFSYSRAETSWRSVLSYLLIESPLSVFPFRIYLIAFFYSSIYSLVVSIFLKNSSVVTYFRFSLFFSRAYSYLLHISKLVILLAISFSCTSPTIEEECPLPVDDFLISVVRLVAIAFLSDALSMYLPSMW